MNDMRFHTPLSPKAEMSEREVGPRRNFLSGKLIVLSVIFIVLIFALFFSDRVKEKFFAVSNNKNQSDYHAVFLDNSQVYFGKIISKSKEEIVLMDVYYLQAGSGGTSVEASNQRFTLIKLGQELHGPTGEMMINMEHVVFYEKLRSDSKVVDSIKEQN